MAAKVTSLASATAPLVTLDDVRAAAERIRGKVERTPIRRSQTLSQITGADVWIKFENQQFTAAFKERGALNKLMLLTDEERAGGVIAMSAGNHAQGVAYHADKLGVAATIVMPKGTPYTKIQHTRAFGARVILHGDTLTEADEHAHELAEQEGLTFVHPYDDEAVIAGQGTIALEMLEDAPDLEMLVVPVGGGGLIAGMATAAKGLFPTIRVIGVEPRLYPSMSAALEGREARVGGGTIAEGIAVKKVGVKTLAIARRLVNEVVTVDESHLERAVALLVNVEKTVAEGAGGAGLAALLAHPDRFYGRKVGVVLCGGNIDSRMLASVLVRDMVRERRLISFKLVEEDRVGLFHSVTKVISGLGANIIEVAHNRSSLATSAKGVEVMFQVETRDAHHAAEVLDGLRDAGLDPIELINE